MVAIWGLGISAHKFYTNIIGNNFENVIYRPSNCAIIPLPLWGEYSWKKKIRVNLREKMNLHLGVSRAKLSGRLREKYYD